MKWHENLPSNYNNVIMSSRIRLARNLKDFVFPNRKDKEQSTKVIQDIYDLIFQDAKNKDKFEFFDMSKVDPLEQVAMVERHLISPLFVNTSMPHALLISKEGSVSVMINEEDHLRIQSMIPGGHLGEAYAKANRLDDLIEEKLDYAYDDQLGYLTACPTNLGTGLRASYMIHVPALESTGQLRIILDAIGKFGITFRGIYGESSEPVGSVFQISNQVTLGFSEEEIMANLHSLTLQIVEQEMSLRNKLISNRRLEFEDTIFRSYGILSQARILTAKEAMRLLSDVKLGMELGILKTEEDVKVDIFDLMTSIQPGNLQKKEKKDLDVTERDVARANLIRQALPKIQGG